VTEPKINGIAKSIYDVLQNNRFSIDYYQRQYRWESKRVPELLNDLADRFSEAWDPGLTRSLHQQTYERHPGFGRFVAASGLNFKPYEPFTKDSILERGELYRQIAKRVWNPEDLRRVSAERGL
jgi:hypothetical protein